MKTIKKTTLIAAITAMAAIAVPSMASAAGWAPLNANKTLTSSYPSIAQYMVSPPQDQWSFQCSNSTLGVHVRNPASTTLDITSATFTNCVTVGSLYCGPATVTATGLPWTATKTGSSVTFTEHLLVDEQCLHGQLLTVDGPATGSYNNTTHTLSAHAATGMNLNYMGSPVGPIGNIPTTTWHETTDTLTVT
jgi:hypothetical protein